MLIRDYPGSNAIKVGGLFLKPSSVNDRITRSCRLVLLEADDRTLPLWRAGSATLIKYANTRYVVTTRHELDIPPRMEPPKGVLETIRISSGVRQLGNIPIQSCIYEIDNYDQEYHDLLIFKVADAWENQQTDSVDFFPLTPFSRERRRKSFLVGYPTLEGVMDEYFDGFYSGTVGEIHIKRAIGDCDLDGNFKTNAEYFRRYTQSKHRHVDGYSGGAVFSLIGNLENMEIFLDGIIVRGDPLNIYIVDADYLVKVLERQ